MYKTSAQLIKILEYFDHSFQVQSNTTVKSLRQRV